LSQQAQVTILNMTSITSKMNRYAVGTRELADNSRFDGVRLCCLACLPDGCDVIDID